MNGLACNFCLLFATIYWATKRIQNETLHKFCSNTFLDTMTHTYIESPQQQQRGLQAYREDQAQYGGGNKRPDSVRLGQDDDYSQRNQHGHPQQGRQMGLQGT